MISHVCLMLLKAAAPHGLPVAFRSYSTARSFEQAARTEVVHRFFVPATWTTEMMAFVAVQEVFKRVEGVIGSGGIWIE